jgi:hypothetical protein
MSMESSMDEGNEEGLTDIKDAPEPEICLPEFPVRWAGVTLKRGGRTFQVTGGKDPVTGQEVFLHVELVKNEGQKNK